MRMTVFKLMFNPGQFSFGWSFIVFPQFGSFYVGPFELFWQTLTRLTP